MTATRTTVTNPAREKSQAKIMMLIAKTVKKMLPGSFG